MYVYSVQSEEETNLGNQDESNFFITNSGGILQGDLIAQSKGILTVAI